MPQPDSEFMQSVHRCAEAYRHVRARLPKNADFDQQDDNNQNACHAYLANLPILYDPTSFQAFIACIAQGVTLGVIDLVDAGRYCHLAQMAMSAWKLANLTAAQKKEAKTHPLPPNGNHSESSGVPGLSHLGTREGCRTASQPSREPQKPSKPPQSPDPLPPNGNHPKEDLNQKAAAELPDGATQAKIYQSLRQQGVSIPDDAFLSRNPMVAAYYCNRARNLQNEQPSADDNHRPAPRPSPLKEPDQAA